MRLLCELTDWKEDVVQRGRSAGSVTRFRYVIAADNWNWLIGIQRTNESTQVVGEAFVGSMNMLFSFLDKKAEDYHVKADDIKHRVISSLEKVTGKQAPKPNMTGSEVDNFFQTSQMKKYPPTVIKDVFGGTEEED
jgi:hypothetical protein